MRMANSRSFGVERDHAFDGVHERLQILPQTAGRLGNSHPAPSPKLVLEPAFEDLGDAHQVDVNLTPLMAFDEQIAAEPLSRDHAEQAGFLLRLADRRFAGVLASFDRPLRHDPALALGCGHQGHLDALFADPIGNDRRLVAHVGHQILQPLDWRETVPKSHSEYKHGPPAARSVRQARHGGAVLTRIPCIMTVKFSSCVAEVLQTRLVAEPGGATAFAALLSRVYLPRRGERVGVIVCGGNVNGLQMGLAV